MEENLPAGIGTAEGPLCSARSLPVTHAHTCSLQAIRGKYSHIQAQSQTREQKFRRTEDPRTVLHFYSHLASLDYRVSIGHKYMSY